MYILEFWWFGLYVLEFLNLGFVLLGQPADYSLIHNFQSMIKDDQIDSKKRNIQHFSTTEFDGTVRSK